MDDVNLAIKRVAQRVKQGGHNIPKEIIIRRYYRGIKNLLNVFVNLCYSWTIVNNSTKDHNIIAEGSMANLKIIDKHIWNDLIKFAKNSEK